MGAPELLQHLRGAGLVLTLTHEGGLHVAPRDALTDEYRSAIRAHRAELLALVVGTTGHSTVAINTASTATSTPASADAGSAPPAIEADRWCWPDSDAMNTAELRALAVRTERFIRQGIGGDEASMLADQLVARDREGDDRRLCLECSWLGDGGRCIAAATGRLPDADRRLEPVTTILQRCPAFGLRKGLQ
jgi:hypothetical protein